MNLFCVKRNCPVSQYALSDRCAVATRWPRARSGIADYRQPEGLVDSARRFEGFQAPGYGQAEERNREDRREEVEEGSEMNLLVELDFWAGFLVSVALTICVAFLSKRCMSTSNYGKMDSQDELFNRR